MATIKAPNASIAWLRAIEHLSRCGGECSNLMVQIANPVEIDSSVHQVYEQLVSNHGLRTLKQVIYTIFPKSLYQTVGLDSDKLFDIYNRDNGVYDRLRRRHGQAFGWGSYFRRMTCYPGIDSQGNAVTTNQLIDIITMLCDRGRVYKAAYTVSIQIPSIDGRRTMGGPCLNYIALQLENPRLLNLLAVYRNHDFIERAYGNYLGIGYLMEFLCDQTGYTLGTLNCLSSHATIANIAGRRMWPRTVELRELVERLEQNREDVQTPS